MRPQAAGAGGEDAARQAWAAGGRTCVVALTRLLLSQSELLLSQLPGLAATLSHAVSATARAAGDTAELHAALRCLSVRALAERLRWEHLAAMCRAVDGRNTV